MSAVQGFEQAGQRLRSRRAELLVRRRRVDNDLERRNEPLVADFGDQAIQRQNDETLEEIPAARLHAMPHATACVHCLGG